MNTYNVIMKRKEKQKQKIKLSNSLIFTKNERQFHVRSEPSDIYNSYKV